ncbi:hypothetical protein [Christiangramia sp. SM2212]|uniref:Uncharacterized protein n=1 Tax=Christiangramia sediminicola TaxID=3073267 RepID=A0ABU1EL17_9FLAO|nr:hypothetical protein [Christiangramia sp. SM2212]MDR5589075.1 hypothetical protein [Christiangramia sp. SM2212]
MEMNKVRIYGLICLITGILALSYFERSDLDFLAGILTGIGIGWFLTGKFFVFNKNEKNQIRN